MSNKRLQPLALLAVFVLKSAPYIATISINNFKQLQFDLSRDRFEFKVARARAIASGS